MEDSCVYYRVSPFLAIDMQEYISHFPMMLIIPYQQMPRMIVLGWSKINLKSAASFGFVLLIGKKKLIEM